VQASVKIETRLALRKHAPFRHFVELWNGLECLSATVIAFDHFFSVISMLIHCRYMSVRVDFSL
jgi:hypothetical protein